MAMFIRTWLVVVLLALLSLQSVFSVDPPETSPSPSPEPNSNSVSPPPPSSPSPLPDSSSPPAPPPSDLAPGSSPTPSPAPSEDTPVPSPNVGISHENVDADVKKDDSSSSGLTTGQKAGIAVGVIAGACIVGFGGILYKKRQQNIRRSEYGYAARREIL